jgi:hypothetical protein
MAGAVIVMAIVVFVAGVVLGAIGALAGIRRKDSRLAIYAYRLSGLGREDVHLPPGGPLSH